MATTGFGKLFRRAVILLGWIVSFTVNAQRTLSYTEPDVHFRNGMEFFEKKNFTASRQEFIQYLEKKKSVFTSDQNAVTAEYYITVSGLYLDLPEAEVLVDRFVKNYSEHPKASQMYGDLGGYYFNKGDFDPAIVFLEKAVKQNNFQQAENQYRLAMSYYSKKNFPSALLLLNHLKQDAGLEQAAAASYYAGVINFRSGNYQEALADFHRIEKNALYQKEIPNWVVQTLYKSGKYDELLAYTQPLLQQEQVPSGRLMEEVALYTAEVFYKRNNFAKAATYYKVYSNTKGRSAPAAILYRYGDALFQTGEYQGSVNVFKALSIGKDTVAQFAAYRLGVSYLQLQNPNYALTAFDQAIRLPFNKAIAEESTFNHAKLQLDLNNGEASVKEFTEFLKKYPNSHFENEVTELLSEAYFSSNNYAAAISYIEGLKRRTVKVNASYQRITYNQAVADFNADRYSQAIANFDKSLQVPVDNDLRNDALFWKAETYSVLKKYDEAIPLYNQVSRMGTSDLQGKSLYALGYAYYNKKDYVRALTYFRDFISKSGSSDKQVIEDAVVRVADCYFVAKNYNEATRYYDQAIASGRIDRDYATYQKGMIFAFMERNVEAKAQFEQLIAQFPNSRYSDDALFQAANVDFERGAYSPAIRGFTRMINERPKSTLLPVALLKRATAYTNLQIYQQAIDDYNRILEQYGGSMSASSALLGLQNALSDAGRTEEFSQILAKYKQTNPGNSNLQKIEFENAKNLFFNGKYQQSIVSFLAFIDDNPGGSLLPEAYFYLADSYFRSMDQPNALIYYSKVINDGKSDFVSRAAERVAEIELSQKNYPQAVRNYRLLLAQSNSKSDQAIAMLGLMDTYYAMSNYDSTQVYIREALVLGNVVPGTQSRAQLMSGKVAYAKGDFKKATEEFEKTITLTKDGYGAEATYWLGNILYRNKKYKESIDILLQFNTDFAQQEYWKGKGFILVADNNVALNEIAQAKAVLHSIVENASNQEIVSEAKQKLSALDGKN